MATFYKFYHVQDGKQNTVASYGHPDMPLLGDYAFDDSEIKMIEISKEDAEKISEIAKEMESENFDCESSIEEAVADLVKKYLPHLL